MKNFSLIILLFTSINLFGQYTQIPDAIFENALSAYDDIPSDGQVPTANISTITGFHCNYLGIIDLTGIEDFTALYSLTCHNNNLTSLDVSANTALTNLDCGFNSLTSLDVSSNIALTYFSCRDNSLTSLDVRNGFNQNIIGFMAINNPNLTCIYVDDNNASYFSGWGKDATSFYVNDEAECSALAINEISTYNSIKVYPTPAKGNFNIQTNKKVISVELYDIFGKAVRIYTTNKYSLEGINSGLYFIHINTEKGKVIQKIVID